MSEQHFVKLPFIASGTLDVEAQSFHGEILLSSPTLILGMFILMPQCVRLLSNTVSLKLARASA